ncbi:hypothetical protein [Rhodococcus sp. B10]|uniref:hypothetical protein n=1 Tax=Rhodococcus sp. B10 TaxID=2695876 RepID=UPI00142FCF1F|nr:hypothetical protein [Rhodococcus sp. B10]NIL76783.1 hypothetical protein [Rhodococcus sp. B10]
MAGQLTPVLGRPDRFVSAWFDESASMIRVRFEDADGNELGEVGYVEPTEIPEYVPPTTDEPIVDVPPATDDEPVIEP